MIRGFFSFVGVKGSALHSFTVLSLIPLGIINNSVYSIVGCCDTINIIYTILGCIRRVSQAMMFGLTFILIENN